jgi:hypothetical protein
VVRPKQATAYRPRHLPSTRRNHEHQPQIQGQANGSPKPTGNHIIKRRIFFYLFIAFLQSTQDT